MNNRVPAERPAFRVFNNTVSIIGGDLVYHLINFFAGILVARSLGSERYGQFSFVFVYLSFFEIFVQFGLNSILTRELAQKKEEAPRILGSALSLRLLLIGCALPIALILIRLSGYPLSIQQSVFLASFQLFLNLRSVYEIIFRVNLLMIYPALLNTVRALINLALVAGIFFFHPHVLLFVLAYVGSGFLGLAATLGVSRRFVRIRFEWDPSLMKRLLKESAPLLFSGYLTLLYYRIDVMMLSMMKGFAEVGYYSVATRLTESLDIIANSLMISLFPLLSKAFKEDRQQFDRLLSKTFSILLLAGFPLAIGGSLAAQDLVIFLFGKGYARSGVTLGILFWYTFFGFFSTFFVNLLIVCGKQVVDAWISFFLVLVNIGMNLLWIPSYSYHGAALATVMTEVFGTLAMLIYALKHPLLRLSFPLRELGEALKVNLLFLAALFSIKIFFPLPVLGFVGAGILIYALLLWGMQWVSFEDLKSYLSQGVKALTGGRP